MKTNISNISNINILILLHLFKILSPAMTLLNIKRSQIVISIDRNFVYSISFFFKRYTNTQINYLSDICGVDFPQQSSRFEIVYNFLSLTFNSRLRIRTCIHELIAINSLESIFLSAYWLERKLWDMLVIFFLTILDYGGS